MLEMNSRLRTERGSKSLTLRDIATPLFRRKRLLIGAFLFAFAMAASLGLLRFHKYESQMTILVSRERLDPVVTAGATNRIGHPPPLTDREVNSDAELLKTHDLLEQVVLANGLQNPHGGRFLNFFRRRQTQEDRVAGAVQALVSQIQVETAPQTNLIKVTYRSPDRDLAYGVLKSLSNLYLEKHAHDPQAARLQPVSHPAGAALQSGSGGCTGCFARIRAAAGCCRPRSTRARSWPGNCMPPWPGRT